MPKGCSPGNTSRSALLIREDSLRASLPERGNGKGTVSNGWASKSISMSASHSTSIPVLARIWENDAAYPPVRAYNGPWYR